MAPDTVWSDADHLRADLRDNRLVENQAHRSRQVYGADLSLKFCGHFCVLVASGSASGSVDISGRERQVNRFIVCRLCDSVIDLRMHRIQKQK